METKSTVPPVLEDEVVYIAVKGSLHANDCSVFGLGQEEISALAKKYPGSGSSVVNGISMKSHVLDALNSLGQLGYKIISSTAFNGEINEVQRIIDKSRNAKDTVNAPDNSGYTALHYAARRGHVDVCKLLLRFGADVNAQTSGQATPLHKAAAAGKENSVKFLIESGAKIEMQDIDGETALHKAIDNKHYDLHRTLLEYCPELANIKDCKGRLALVP